MEWMPFSWGMNRTAYLSATEKGLFWQSRGNNPTINDQLNPTQGWLATRASESLWHILVPVQVNSATWATKLVFKQENAVFITEGFTACVFTLFTRTYLSCHLVCRVNFRVICLTRALNMTTESQPNLSAAEGAVCRRKAAGQSKPNLTSKLCADLTPHLYLIKSFINLLIFHIFDCVLT